MTSLLLFVYAHMSEDMEFSGVTIAYVEVIFLGMFLCELLVPMSMILVIFFFFMFSSRTHKRLVSDRTEARELYRRGMHPKQRRRLEYPPQLNPIPKFPQWLRIVVQAGDEVFEEDVLDLSILPSTRTKSFKSMKAFGIHFQVSSAESNLVTADSGVTVTCETMQQNQAADANAILGEVTYYGKIEEILELNYGRLKPILLYCNWVPPISRGPTAYMKMDKYGFTLVKLTRQMRRSANSFVFPLQASQVFFINCEEEPEWSTVLKTNSRSTRVFQESDVECRSNLFDGNDGLFVHDTVVDEDVDYNSEDELNDTVSDHIIEEEMGAFDVNLGVPSEESDEEVSSDDSVL